MCTISLNTKSSQLSIHSDYLLFVQFFFVLLEFCWKGKKSHEPLLLFEFFSTPSNPLRLLKLPVSPGTTACVAAEHPTSTGVWGVERQPGPRWKVKLEFLRGFCVFFRRKNDGILRNAPKKKQSFKRVFPFWWISRFDLASLITS